MPNFCEGKKPAYLVTVWTAFFFVVVGILCVESWKLFRFHSAKAIGFSQSYSLIISPKYLLSSGTPRVNNLDMVPPLTVLHHSRSAWGSCSVHNRGTIQNVGNDNEYIYYGTFPAGDSKMS